jgi:hypothetical protein
MSLTAVNPESQRDVALLQDLLHKREYHLAELIDEVVFAEQERYKAVQEAHSVRELATHLEEAFDKLLYYHITMHKEVLLPALVASVDVDGVNSRRASVSCTRPTEDENYESGGDATADRATPSNDFLNDLLTEPQLSRETKHLLQAVMQQRKNRGAGTSARLSTTPLPSPSSRAVYDHRNGGDGVGEGVRSPTDTHEVAQRATRRAIVLSDSLLRNQETLTRLLRSIQDQTEEMLDRLSQEGNAAIGGSEPHLLHHPAVKLRSDSNMMQTSSPHSSAAATLKRRNSEAAATASTASFRLDNLHQHSDRVREIEESLRKVEEERDALQRQLLERESGPMTTYADKALATEKEAWGKERVHLKQELAYAQQRALEEQARCRELKKQVAQLEQIAATSPIPVPPPPARPDTCNHCEKLRTELKKTAADYHNAKAVWKSTEQRLKAEVESLQRHVQEAEAKAVSAETVAVAATALEKERSLAPPVSPTASKDAAATSAAAQTPRYPAGPSSERKIGQLEATVAAMKADLQIMEMRMSIIQDEREAERRRILAAHEQERARLRRERDECQKIIDKMSRELQGLSRSNVGVPAIASTSF